MDDQEFFDDLYRVWTQIDGEAWLPEADDENELWRVRVVDAEGRDVRDPIQFLTGAEAAFVSKIHGALPDIVRRYLAAQDEAERLDIERDNLVAEVMRLELELAEVEADQIGRS
ncbi:hypothetical protein [Nocardia terpenica]|uniref:Uncharacterized protein n=1 Tax=Nocardia terpenica TaxID=455432 RepID=A0A164HW69_9NOCA|nr:hypothetical protein [Nocardia terpenica]KZM68871.1 hypothetical protein AWN90_13875 [Nocardia terpenica]NQE88083.1 hypothetical protein [Nocardia terpenica]